MTAEPIHLFVWFGRSRWETACRAETLTGTLIRKQVTCPACVMTPVQLELRQFVPTPLQVLAVLLREVQGHSELQEAFETECADDLRDALEVAAANLELRVEDQLAQLELTARLAREQGRDVKHWLWQADDKTLHIACGEDGACSMALAYVNCLECLLEAADEVKGPLTK